MHQTRIFQQPFTSHTQPVSSHSQKSPKVEPLLSSKNWQLYLSVVYLFLTPLQQNLLTHFITQIPSSQALAPDKNIPAAFYTKAFLHPSSPNTFYTRHLLYQAHLHQKPFRPDTFYTRHILHEAPFTPDTSYTNRLLHQTTFAPDNFYINQLLHQTSFTQTSFYTRLLLPQTPFTPDNFHTRQFLHQPTFTPDNFYTRHLLHQTPCTQMRMLASQRLEIAICIFKIFTFLGTNGFQNIYIFGYQCFSKY